MSAPYTLLMRVVQVAGDACRAQPMMRAITSMMSPGNSARL